MKNAASRPGTTANYNNREAPLFIEPGTARAHRDDLCEGQSGMFLCGELDEVAKRTSGVDLTFATPLAASSSSECQIQKSTRNLYLLVVLLILTFAKAAAAKGCEC